MSYLLGIDLGSSSVKVSLVDADSGQCVASAYYPETEAPIMARQLGWAEQRPDDWWLYFKEALRQLALRSPHSALHSIVAIGISYQMHGLVCLDKDMRPLRDAIIWCDSRGVPYGERAFDTLGHELCLSHLLNSPGNFTASKLAWVRENEPTLFDKIRYIMLPGDYLALRLTGTAATTACGLSEMMLYDYVEGGLADFLMDYYGFTRSILPSLVPTFGEQGRVSEAAARELGLNVGIPVTYRSGDQPNNALSLRVLHPGEIASTAGTSGVVYGVVDNFESQNSNSENLDSNSKSKIQNSNLINTFLHVNHTLGLMHCINGCGILNSWLRHNVVSEFSYEQMNDLAATVPVGSEGVSIIPFGNGAERVLGNKDIGASIHGLNFNLHTRAHLLRAAQDGIAFSMMYGMEMMNDFEFRNSNFENRDSNSKFEVRNSQFKTIRAGRANMFLSPLFRDTLASVSGATIELYDTDGSIGAARGAGLGAGIYANEDEAFASLRCLAVVEPSNDTAPYREAYMRWKEILLKQSGN